MVYLIKNWKKKTILISGVNIEGKNCVDYYMCEESAKTLLNVSIDI